MINVETKVEKLSIPEDTMLVEVVSQDNGNNHMVYYLAEDGSIIDFIHVVNTRIADVIRAIPHMMVINFTEKRFWQMACETMTYNSVFEPDIPKYDDFDCWSMDATMVELFRHWCKIINVANYKETEEYMAEVHIVDDYKMYTRMSVLSEVYRQIVLPTGTESRRYQHQYNKNMKRNLQIYQKE